MKLGTGAGRRGQSFSPFGQPVVGAAETPDRLVRSSFPSAARAVFGGSWVRTFRFLSLCAASLVALAPVQASAQTANESASVRDRARPEFDPLGVRVGGFDLNATLDLGVASTDNLFAEQANEDSDILYHLTPSARLSSHWSRHALSLVAGADFKSHADFSNEDAETGYLGADGRLDVGGNSSISASARFARDVEPRTNPDAATLGNPVEFEHTDLALVGRHQFNRFRVIGTLAQSEYRYDDAPGRDSDENSFTGRVEAEITPRIGALFQARADERDYDNNPGLSSEGRTYLAGVSFNLTDLMRGEVALGQFDRDYNSGANVSGTAISGSLEWYITRLTTLNFSAHRNAEDTSATVAQPYVESEYGLQVDHEILRNVILTAGIRAGQREYEAIDRQDEFTSGQVGADYLFSRRIVLQARLTRDKTESSGVNAYRDYEVNALSLGASLRL
ncbi:MAG: outer membrane beta-barrel protein [Terricaulis sp.]